MAMAEAGGMSGSEQEQDEQVYYHQQQEEGMETQQPQTLGGGGEGMEGETPAPEGEGGNAATYAGAQIPYDKHKLFVGGLSWETDENSLKDYFSQYGTVSDINLKYDQASGKSRGFAFVVFTHQDAVDKVLETIPHTIDGREVDAKKAIPHQIHQAMKHRTKKIFVGGVPTDMPEDTIRDYFIQFGDIEEVALVTDKGNSQKRRGFVFVTYINEDSVDKCTDKTFHTLEGHQVEVKRATPREQNPAGPLSRGRGRGGFGRAGWTPYGHFGYYGGGGGGYPYGGGGGAYGGNYGGYGGGGGGWGGYGGYGGGGGGFEQYGPPYGGGGRGYGSRYGPMKQSYNHGGYHPYQR